MLQYCTNCIYTQEKCTVSAKAVLPSCSDNVIVQSGDATDIGGLQLTKFIVVSNSASRSNRSTERLIKT